jgi:hypothetical protein
VVWLIAGGVGAVIAGLWWLCWLWWQLPKRQVERLRFAIRDPKARADVEDNFRKTTTQLISGILVLFGSAAVLVSAGLTYYGVQQTLTANAKQARDLLISNQVSKGFEQLGDQKSMVVRLGGIYALEGVMNISEQYHRPVLEALSAFVRDSTSDVRGDEKPAADIQAALSVIGRREAIVSGVNPDLRYAHISGADLGDTNLCDAYLFGADLSNADLRGAILFGANLHNAILKNADLRSAVMTDTIISGADLRGAKNISPAQLDKACGMDPVLDSGRIFHNKPCPNHNKPCPNH